MVLDFSEKIAQFSKRVEGLKDQIQTEEATKTALIMPFFQMLGYDVFNPSEFMPEFTADVGIKKGEKIDYAIFLNGALSILLEAKAINDNLDKHGSQLFRYYATSPARFGILTNGILYKFYTDLDAPNKMDERPFLEFNFLDIKENLVPEIRKFERNNFDCDNILNSATELKYTGEIKKLLASEMSNPSDDFIRFMLKDIYTGMKTQAVIDKFRDTTRKAFYQFVTDILNDRFKAVINPSTISESAPPTGVESVDPEPVSKIVTTMEELEAFAIVKAMLKDTVPPARIFYRDTESYFGILLDDNKNKWICRVAINKTQINLYIPDENKKSLRYPLNSINDIFDYQAQLTEAVKHYLTD
jgi:predicted type IV restriction endonuclease